MAVGSAEVVVEARERGGVGDEPDRAEGRLVPGRAAQGLGIEEAGGAQEGGAAELVREVGVRPCGPQGLGFGDQGEFVGVDAESEAYAEGARQGFRVRADRRGADGGEKPVDEVAVGGGVFRDGPTRHGQRFHGLQVVHERGVVAGSSPAAAGEKVCLPDRWLRIMRSVVGWSGVSR